MNSHNLYTILSYRYNVSDLNIHFLRIRAFSYIIIISFSQSKLKNYVIKIALKHIPNKVHLWHNVNESQ